MQSRQKFRWVMLSAIGALAVGVAALVPVITTTLKDGAAARIERENQQFSSLCRQFMESVVVVVRDQASAEERSEYDKYRRPMATQTCDCMLPNVRAQTTEHEFRVSIGLMKESRDRAIALASPDTRSAKSLHAKNPEKLDVLNRVFQPTLVYCGR
jgi:hypothetical protein